MPIKKILLLLAAAHASCAAQHSAPPLKSLSDTSTLMTDTSAPGRPGKSFVAGTIINAPVAKVCATLQDYPNYPAFMPNVDTVKVAAGPDNTTLLDVTLKLPMGKIKKYRLRMTPKPAPDACQLSWKLVPWEGLKPAETIVDTSGYWQLAPHPANPGRTVINYVVYTDPGPIPIGLGWIVDSMSKDSIPKTMDALRARVAR
jgi:uncharacterized membrane protein